MSRHARGVKRDLQEMDESRTATRGSARAWLAAAGTALLLCAALAAWWVRAERAPETAELAAPTESSPRAREADLAEPATALRSAVAPATVFDDPPAPEPAAPPARPPALATLDVHGRAGIDRAPWSALREARPELAEAALAVGWEEGAEDVIPSVALPAEGPLHFRVRADRGEPQSAVLLFHPGLELEVARTDAEALEYEADFAHWIEEPRVALEVVGQLEGERVPLSDLILSSASERIRLFDAEAGTFHVSVKPGPLSVFACAGPFAFFGEAQVAEGMSELAIEFPPVHTVTVGLSADVEWSVFAVRQHEASPGWIDLRDVGGGYFAIDLPRGRYAICALVREPSLLLIFRELDVDDADCTLEFERGLPPTGSVRFELAGPRWISVESFAPDLRLLARAIPGSFDLALPVGRYAWSAGKAGSHSPRLGPAAEGQLTVAAGVTTVVEID